MPCAAHTLTEDNKRTVRAFLYKMKHNMTNQAFRDLPGAFRDIRGLRSWKKTQADIGKISGLKPELYDCCPNSCLCYVGKYADLQECPHCKETRLDRHGRPRRRFSYIPLIPRLKAFLADQEQAAKMAYRAEYMHLPDVIKDVFDGVLYRNLLGKLVTPVGGPTQRHAYFGGATDVALGLSTDGYAPFRRRKKTAWPIIIFNYNLPPDVRFHLENVLCLGVVPGPQKPKDFDSFLWPLVLELLQLELGVPAVDAHTGTRVELRAFLLYVFGDIPAVSMVMRMKGHNGICPCRFCTIRGVRIPGSENTTHYVPLDRSHHPAVRTGESVPSYDPRALPKRTHRDFLVQAREVDFADTAGIQEHLAKEYGIKGTSVLARLSTISFPDSFPYDFMHLIWENVVKNLHLLWFGDFKGLGTGSARQSYKLSPKVVEAIGKESAASGASIPYAFGAAPPNIAKDGVQWTAESRAFWTLHVAPPLLRKRLPDVFYLHFVELIKLLDMCLAFEMDRTQIAVLREGFAAWVERYEQYVYICCIHQACVPYVAFQAILPVQSRTARHVPGYHPRAASSRRLHRGRWSRLDHLGVSNGALLRPAPACG
jgi:hypothetical protein